VTNQERYNATGGEREHAYITGRDVPTPPDFMRTRGRDTIGPAASASDTSLAIGARADELANALANLEERLRPVLLASSPEKPSHPEPRPPLSPLVEELHHHERRLRALVEYVNDLAGRVQT
jgi:hypothetical protein